MECIHELESGCTYCSGKETTTETPRPIKLAKRPDPKRARKSPAMERARLIAKGELCEKCLTRTGIKLVMRDGVQHIDHVGLGCQCSRRGDYQVRMALTTSWLRENRAAFKPMGAADEKRANRAAERIVTGLAFSTQARAGRRAGVARDAISDGTSPGCSEAEADRLDLLAEFGVDPKWHAARNQEADKLPV